jgi:hypothetical protein
LRGGDDDAILLGAVTTMIEDPVLRRIEERFDRIDTRFDQVDARFTDLKRHMEVLTEAIRDDIRLLAEAVVHSHARLENHETRIQRLEGGQR